MKLRVPITKVDAVQRLVYGQATSETPDKSGEIFDYASSKPHFEAWSGEISKATDGKSLGNVRAMHGDVAAGKLTAIAFDDDAKTIDVCAKIVDDNEWKKVEEGVYTGFSIGGAYERRWNDPTTPTLRRFEARPVEISIVDNPCVPSARFSMIKADGLVEERAFASVADERAIALADAVAAVKAAALDGGKLRKGMWELSSFATLLESVKALAVNAEWEAEWERDGSTIPAALRAWLNTGAALFGAMAAEETAELVRTPEEAAALALDAAAGLAAKSASGAPLGDGAIDDADLAGGERERAEDAPPAETPADAPATASIEPVAAPVDAPVDAPAEAEDAAKRDGGDLAKAGARHSAADLVLIQNTHDAAIALGAACPPCAACAAAATKAAAPAAGALDGEAVAALAKAAGGSLGDVLAKTLAAADAARDESRTLAKALEATTLEKAALAARVTALEAQAAPGKGVTRLVAKRDDAAPLLAAEPDAPADASPRDLIKSSHRSGGVRLAPASR